MTEIIEDQPKEDAVTDTPVDVTEAAPESNEQPEDAAAELPGGDDGTVPDPNVAQDEKAEDVPVVLSTFAPEAEAPTVPWSVFVSDHFDAEILDMQLSIERFKICREAANAFIETLEAYRLSGAFKGGHLKAAFDSLIGRVDFIMYDLNNFGTVPVPEQSLNTAEPEKAA